MHWDILYLVFTFLQELNSKNIMWQIVNRGNNGYTT
jgi:hypothetical protein